MKSIFKILRNSAFALMGIAMISTTSCKDDIDTSNMYTFTGHMITDYLAESDSFQLYSYCLRKVYLSDRSKSTFADLLSARGNYTVFAPTDEAMHHFLDSIYNQTDFPIENCEDSIMEKIVRNCIIENGDNEAYRIEDLNEGALPKTNADDRYLTLNFDTLGGRAIAVINNDARVISSNLEMENGYVHACDRVVMLSNAYVSSLLEEAGNMRIFSMLKLPLLLGFDFGLTPACVFCQQLGGQLRVLRERFSDDSGLKQFLLSDVIPLLRSPEFAGLPVEAVGDPAGIQRAQADDTLSCFGILAMHGIPARPAPTNDFQPRRQAVLDLLGQLGPGGVPNLMLDPSCERLRKGFISGYRFNRKPGSDGTLFKDTPEKNQYSHIHDALQYAALKTVMPALREQRDRMNGFTAPPPPGGNGWNGYL